ncbi:glutaredoxin-like protein C5orf63 homolog [Physella acuta]|uniref:glutaredoxin-like protein C5orf63 homolog n=1 Tax=Physella acuta TaxID=109671 RepID=UPI0027DAF87F|nr:glutaredoxin-like protein C5orf63 homolog [Physella acuta]
MRTSLFRSMLLVNYSVGISSKRSIRSRSSITSSIISRFITIKCINNPPSWASSKAGTLGQFDGKKMTYAFLNLTNFHNESTNRARPVLTLYTKDPCPLCDEALEALGPALLNQVVLQKVDITAPGNEQFWKAYRYDIPVFHLDGKFLMKHKANIDVFNEGLKKYYSQKDI